MSPCGLWIGCAVRMPRFDAPRQATSFHDMRRHAAQKGSSELLGTTQRKRHLGVTGAPLAGPGELSGGGGAWNFDACAFVFIEWHLPSSHLSSVIDICQHFEQDMQRDPGIYIYIYVYIHIYNIYIYTCNRRLSWHRRPLRCGFLACGAVHDQN